MLAEEEREHDRIATSVEVVVEEAVVVVVVVVMVVVVTAAAAAVFTAVVVAAAADRWRGCSPRKSTSTTVIARLGTSGTCGWAPASGSAIGQPDIRPVRQAEERGLT